MRKLKESFGEEFVPISSSSLLKDLPTDSGDLMPCEIINKRVHAEIDKHIKDGAHFFIFDGWPRTIRQWEHAKLVAAEYGAAYLLIFLELPKEKARERIEGR